MLIHKREGSQGFTIVELLIVVVIIAILAAITLVTYNGIQQRANNAAIIDAASKSLRMIQAYIAANDKYPATQSLCITTTTGCMTDAVRNASTTFETNMATIGSLPRTTPVFGANRYGITYDWNTTYTMNGTIQPARIVYWLDGTSQQCGLPVAGSWTSPMVSSTTGYSIANDSSTGKTLCVVSLSGPTS